MGEIVWKLSTGQISKLIRLFRARKREGGGERGGEREERAEAEEEGVEWPARTAYD